jgi:hypothetical protein
VDEIKQIEITVRSVTVNGNSGPARGMTLKNLHLMTPEGRAQVLEASAACVGRTFVEMQQEAAAAVPERRYQQPGERIPQILNVCPACGATRAEGLLGRFGDAWARVTANGKLVGAMEADGGPVLCVTGQRRCEGCQHIWLPRYLAFAGDDHYPSGGWSDFIGAFDTAEQARDAICEQEPTRIAGKRRCVNSWGHIVDAVTAMRITEDEIRPWEFLEQ